MQPKATQNITKKVNSQCFRTFLLEKGNWIIKESCFSSGKSAVLPYKMSTGTNTLIFSPLLQTWFNLKVCIQIISKYLGADYRLLNNLKWYSLFYFFSYTQAKNLSSCFSTPWPTDNLGLKLDNQVLQKYMIITAVLTGQCKHTLSTPSFPYVNTVLSQYCSIQVPMQSDLFRLC